MKKLLFGLALLISSFAYCQKSYYVSNAGNSTNSGLTPSVPWNLSKLNASAPTIQPGDNIYFNRGEIFSGTLTIAKSGTSINPITISAYGTGANPIISGFTTITGWANEGGGIYSKVISSAAKTNMVTIDGVQAGMGRTPDVGWYTYQTYDSIFSITSTSVTNALNWTGADVVIRLNDYIINRHPVTSQSGGKLNYSGGARYTGNNNYGFFLTNDLRTLNAYGEWYHNTANNKFYMFFGSVNPNLHTVKAATVNNVLSTTNFDYVKVSNIDFTGSISDAVALQSGADGWKISNCNVSFAGSCGINFGGGNSDTVINTNVITCNRDGIITNASNTRILYDTIVGVGRIVGQAQGIETNYDGIYIAGNGGVATGNVIRYVGYNGVNVRYDPGGAIVSYNRIDSICMQTDDGGGIYTSNDVNLVRVFDHNVISNVIGNRVGCENAFRFLAAGIYMDESTSNVTVTNNSISNSVNAGIKLHFARNNAIRYNTFYNCLYCLDLEDDNARIFGNIIKSNYFVPQNSSQYTVRANTKKNNVPTMAIFDSNYYARPISDNATFFVSDITSSRFINLSQWQSFIGQDAHSKKSPKAITNIAQMFYNSNPSTIPLTISFAGLSRISIDSVIHNNGDTLSGWSSRIYLDNGVAPPTIYPPVARAGADKVITLPTNTTNLDGSASTSTNGSLTYSWTQLTGTASTVSAPTAVSTNITGLTTAGVRSYQLRVTDSLLLQGFDTVNVTVNSGANIPPICSPIADQFIQLPLNSTSVLAVATDIDGSIASVQWKVLAGSPAGYTLINANTYLVTIQNLVQGNYPLQFTATDNLGAVCISTMTVHVISANPYYPVRLKLLGH